MYNHVNAYVLFTENSIFILGYKGNDEKTNPTIDALELILLDKRIT